MAEIATIARPYAEALFKTTTDAAIGVQMNALAAVTADEQLRFLAGNPKASASLVRSVVTDVLLRQHVELSAHAANLLEAVIENGRLDALPEIASQYHALVNSRSGVSDALIESAFPVDGAQLADVVEALEKRFARRLNASVEVKPELIGGIRVVVGDEVLDTSVKARLEQMRAALTA